MIPIILLLILGGFSFLSIRSRLFPLLAALTLGVAIGWVSRHFDLLELPHIITIEFISVVLAFVLGSGSDTPTGNSIRRLPIRGAHRI